ncbi:hypothetical protein [Candidatus Nitrospira salsa]
MKKLHLAIGVSNIEASVEEYSRRLEQTADVVIPDQYALWRTQTLNVSIRKVGSAAVGQLRHLGWENSEATALTSENGGDHILWEEFSAEQQAQEIEKTWPGTGYNPRSL